MTYKRCNNIREIREIWLPQNSAKMIILEIRENLTREN